MQNISTGLFFKQRVALLLNRIAETEFNNYYILRLGGLFDSATKLMYYFNDIDRTQRDKFEFSETVEKALQSAKENDCLVFFDDGAYSGTQVVSIFQELMGIPVEQRITSESHICELADHYKSKLRSSNIVLAYICML